MTLCLQWDFPDAAATGGYRCTVGMKQKHGQSVTEFAGHEDSVKEFAVVTIALKK